MLFHDLFAGNLSDMPAMVARDHAATWRQMAAAVARAVRWLEPLAGKRVGFRFSPSVNGFATLAALDWHRSDTTLLDAENSDDTLDRLAAEFGFAALVTPADGDVAAEGRLEFRGAVDVSAEPGVTILTSGTEGQPKAARHSWESLARPVRRSEPDIRWLLAFRPQLYAGLQVILQCLCNRGCLVVPPARADVADIVQMIVEHRVHCVSATPSYWRRLLLFSDESAWGGADLRQITLGGEIVDQQILDALGQQFPAARVVHIFATTELGRCFAVADGRAGFPVEFLHASTPDGVDLRIRNNLLWARSANAMHRYGVQTPTGTAEFQPDKWFCTGDLVQVSGDRVYFLGRQGETMNVGGNKVPPYRVESVIRSLPGVADVRVFGIGSSITGQLVACEVVPAETAKTDQLRTAIQDAVKQQLAAHERPRFIEFKDQIELTGAAKVSRSPRSSG